MSTTSTVSITKTSFGKINVVSRSSLDGLNCGIPTRTTATLTPTTLKNIEQTFLELQSETSSHHNEARFEPPPLQPVGATSTPLPDVQTNNHAAVLLGSQVLSEATDNYMSDLYDRLSAGNVSDLKNWHGGGVTAVIDGLTLNQSNNMPIPTHVMSVINSSFSSSSSGGDSSANNSYVRKSGGRKPARDNAISLEEEERRELRRQRNKMAAARCRKRRLDHTNELLEETEMLEGRKMALQNEIQALHEEKEELLFILESHKTTCKFRDCESPPDVKPFIPELEVLSAAAVSQSVNTLPMSVGDAISSLAPMSGQNIAIAVPSPLNVARNASPPMMNTQHFTTLAPLKSAPKIRPQPPPILDPNMPIPVTVLNMMNQRETAPIQRPNSILNSMGSATSIANDAVYSTCASFGQPTRLSSYDASQSTISSTYDTSRSAISSAYDASSSAISSAYNVSPSTISSTYDVSHSTFSSTYNGSIFMTTQDELDVKPDAALDGPSVTLIRPNTLSVNATIFRPKTSQSISLETPMVGPSSGSFSSLLDANNGGLTTATSSYSLCSTQQRSSAVPTDLSTPDTTPSKLVSL